MSNPVKFKCPGCNFVITTDRFELHVQRFCSSPGKARSEASRILQLIFGPSHADMMRGLREVEAAKIVSSKPECDA